MNSLKGRPSRAFDSYIYFLGDCSVLCSVLLTITTSQDLCWTVIARYLVNQLISIVFLDIQAIDADTLY